MPSEDIRGGQKDKIHTPKAAWIHTQTNLAESVPKILTQNLREEGEEGGQQGLMDSGEGRKGADVVLDFKEAEIFGWKLGGKNSASRSWQHSFFCSFIPKHLSHTYSEPDAVSLRRGTHNNEHLESFTCSREGSKHFTWINGLNPPLIPL